MRPETAESPAQAGTVQPDLNSPDQVTLEEVDDLLEQVARLVRSESTPQEFHLGILERAVQALAAVAGAVWIKATTGDLVIESRVDLSRSLLIETLAENSGHRDLVKSVMHTGQGRAVLPHATGAAGLSPNPTDYLLLISPLAIGERGAISGAIEVARRTGGSPASQQGFLRFLDAIGELAADFHHQRRLRVFEALAEKSRQIEQFALDVHASLEVTAVALAIATEGRRLIECDRLSVAVRRGQSLRLVAVSGLETLDRRANIVRRLEDLTNAVVVTGEPFWYAGDARPIPPQIAAPLRAWHDESQARSIAVIPLPSLAADLAPGDREPGIAAMIVERFAGERPDEQYQIMVATVARQAELSLSNALAHESIPFFRVLSTLQRARWLIEARRLPTTALALAAVLAALAALVFVPADFEIEGRGTLQPRERRNVFARSDGIISEIKSEESADCREGDVLAVMSKSQLEFESARVLGEMQTARQRLASVQASRLKMSPQSAADREKYNLLTGEEEEVKELLTSVDEQHEILKAQREELIVKSPLTGTVITWNFRQLLEARPVQRGQVLMQVADLDGPWVLEIEVPDDRIGHVLSAREQLRPDLDVSFMLATEAGVTFQGKIEKVAMSTDVRPPEKANVLVTVAIDRDQIPRLRPGATTVSRIHCGRRSIGYVWFHSVWETIQKKVLF
jgi:multidrug efflux pump subunit AcrA (membrane-fusion protein)